MTDAAGADGARGLEPEIPGYRDFSVLGGGATSTVWRAREDGFDRWVAVKVLEPGHDVGPALDRFEREKRITAWLGNHPFIVQVFATGRTVQGRPYMAMDLCERGSVATRIEQLGTFSSDDTIDIGLKIAGALQAAHDIGILHRDIKPQNILLSQYGPALTDFGIARATDAAEWTESLLQLSINHAAPETFLDGNPTAQGDIYALGSTLFTMLSGGPPFSIRRGETPMQYVVRLEREPVPPLRRRDIPDALTAIITRALAKRPEDRFSSAKKLEAALQRLQRGGAPTPEVLRSPVASPPPASDGTDAMPQGNLLPRLSTPIGVTTVPDRDPTVVLPAGRQETGGSTVRSATDPSLTREVDRPRRAAPPAPTPRAVTPAKGGLWWTIGGIAAVVVLLVAAGAYVATRSDGGSDKSATTSTVATTTVGAPANVRATANDTIVTLTWDDTSNGAATQYIVVPIDEDNNHLDVQTVDEVTHATVTGLDPAKGYCFVVIARIGANSAVDDDLSHACIRGAQLTS